MTPMTGEQKKIADLERPRARCARRAEGGCNGYIEVSHPFGRKVQYRWMWVWICTQHHRGRLKSEEIGRYHALLQATDEDLKKWKRYHELKQQKTWLISKYD